MHAMTPMVAFQLPVPVFVLGLVAGSTYGILAVGLILIYRTNRIINFAHGQIGAFGAAVLGLSVLEWHVPYWLGFPVAIALSALVGMLVEIGVVRRLRNAPRLMSIIATLGFAQFLAAFAALIFAQAQAGSVFPEPAGLPSFNLAGIVVTPAYTGMIVLVPVVVVAVALFLRYSRFGIAMRAAAANPDAARLAGVFSGRMSMLAWGIAGAVAAVTAILVFPTYAFVGPNTFGPGLMLRALAAAVIARMSSLPWALVSGLGIGVIEHVLLWNYPNGGFVELALFVIIIVALVLIPPVGGRTEDKGSAWATLQSWRPVAASLRHVWLIRNGAKLLTWGAFGVALLIPVLGHFATAFELTTIFAFTIVGLSLGVITGLAGQLSLGQFALAGLGATVSYYVSSRTNNYVLGVLLGGVAAAVGSLIIGIPALRIRGLMLAVTTLSFALMTQLWLLQQPWMLGAGVNPGHPQIGGFVLDNAKSYYFFALGFMVFAFWLARNVRRSGLGRIMIALRDNEDGARAFTVAATVRKLQAFAIAGFLAGIGGAVYGHALALINYQTYDITANINVVAMAVIGGIGLLAGPLLGALYIFGIPDFVPLDAAGLAASAAGWLFLILYFPSGIGGLVNPLRQRVLAWAARRAGIDPTEADEEPDAIRGVPQLHAVARPAAVEADAVLLEVADVRRRFGGVIAVDDVSLQVRPGETLGLIGPNGAGKTVLFELISGFTRPDSGQITFAGHRLVRSAIDIRGKPRLRRDAGPETRARLGLVRSFQDAALFPTMSVEEALMLALERSNPTGVFASLVGSKESERAKRERARELVSSMGLDSYRHRAIQELSTGTRRITELACLIALEPRLLLLDEPSSGIAQRETEALGQLLMSVKRQLHTTMIIIEHDIPMVMAIADRIVAMEAGRIIASGNPAEIRANPLVVESYLGGDVAAIQRSGESAALAGAGGRR